MSPADPKPARSRKRPPTPAERDQRGEFKPRVFLASGGTCLVHRGQGCDGPLAAHHVVTQAQLRDAGRHDLLWDWRNGVALCEAAHRRHHSGRERIPYALLPSRCVAFAAEHGFDRILARYYTPEAP